MQLSTPTALSARLALVLALGMLTYGASAAPHLHAKRCGSSEYNQCTAAEDCCAFTYCQAELRNNGIYMGVSDSLIQRES